MRPPIQETRRFDDSELREVLREAAEWGARKALADLGLHDDAAGSDVKELRDLLDSWRATKRAAWSTTVKVLTTGFLGLIGLAIWVKTGVPPK